MAVERWRLPENNQDMQPWRREELASTGTGPSRVAELKVINAFERAGWWKRWPILNGDKKSELITNEILRQWDEINRRSEREGKSKDTLLKGYKAQENPLETLRKWEDRNESLDFVLWRFIEGAQEKPIGERKIEAQVKNEKLTCIGRTDGNGVHHEGNFTFEAYERYPNEKRNIDDGYVIDKDGYTWRKSWGLIHESPFDKRVHIVTDGSKGDETNYPEGRIPGQGLQFPEVRVLSLEQIQEYFYRHAEESGCGIILDNGDGNGKYWLRNVTNKKDSDAKGKLKWTRRVIIPLEKFADEYGYYHVPAAKDAAHWLPTALEDGSAKWIGKGKPFEWFTERIYADDLEAAEAMSEPIDAVTVKAVPLPEWAKQQRKELNRQTIEQIREKQLGELALSIICLKLDGKRSEAAERYWDILKMLEESDKENSKKQFDKAIKDLDPKPKSRA